LYVRVVLFSFSHQGTFFYTENTKTSSNSHRKDSKRSTAVCKGSFDFCSSTHTKRKPESPDGMRIHTREKEEGH